MLGLLFAACAAAAGVYGIGFWLFRDRGPPDASYAAAAKPVRDRWRPGDLIILVPYYAGKMREQLGDLSVVAPRDPLAEDLAKHARVWVIGHYGQGAALRDRFAAAGLRLDEKLDAAPGITVDRYTNTSSSTVVFDFRDELRRARVHHQHGDGTVEPCDRWDEMNGQGGRYGRWVCRHDSDWFYVGPEWHRMGDEERLCLWAHPPSDGRLVITFPDVPMTGHLFGRAGHTLNGTLHARERIDLGVRVGDSPEQRITLPLQTNWSPFALLTPETGTATVTFSVSTPDAGANHFCFTADVRRR